MGFKVKARTSAPAWLQHILLNWGGDVGVFLWVGLVGVCVCVCVCEGMDRGE